MASLTQWTSISALLTMPKPLTAWITINYGKFWKRWEYQTTWPAYRFLKRQIRWWYSHLFQNFPQFLVIHAVKGFGIVNKAEIDVFLELSCFFDDPADIGNLISGSPAFSKTSLKIWKFTVHTRMSQIRAKKCLRINVGTHCLHVDRPCNLQMLIL